MAKETKDLSGFYTVEEFSKKYKRLNRKNKSHNVTKQRIHNMIKNGEIKGAKIHFRTTFIPKAELERINAINENILKLRNK
jgi:hypothetical protein